jgi:lipoprotein signal peptidase
MKDKKYLWIIAILLLVFIDQLIKFAVLKNINRGISVIPDILDLSYVENTGVAFGLRCYLGK